MELTSPQVDAVLAGADQLYDEADVEAALDRMAEAITTELSGRLPLVLCTMIGGIVTTGKLLERLHFPLTIDYIHATRYRGATRGAELVWVKRPGESLQERVVLIVDDIFDEGLTMQALVDDCQAAGASAVYSAVLVVKDVDKQVDMAIDFPGVHVENRYVFGYGMDYKGYLRNAPGIYAVKETG